VELARPLDTQTEQRSVLALIRYATWLGIDHREARRLSGLPVEPPRPTC
jgi:hypothetical protein